MYIYIYAYTYSCIHTSYIFSTPGSYLSFSVAPQLRYLDAAVAAPKLPGNFQPGDVLDVLDLGKQKFFGKSMKIHIFFE